MITLTVTNRLAVGPLDRLPGHMLRRITGRLTFDNPRFLENERKGFSNWNVPAQIVGYEIDGDFLTCPRGFIRQLLGILRAEGGRGGVPPTT